mgnify:CR=1 FL=1
MEDRIREIPVDQDYMDGQFLSQTKAQKAIYLALKGLIEYSKGERKSWIKSRTSSVNWFSCLAEKNESERQA